MNNFSIPCDFDGTCPYNANGWGDCEYWCGIGDIPYNYTDEEYEGKHYDYAYEKWV